ncbi:MAG: histidinol-phosphatase HisJ family protein [Acutalibacteraceae bacterium]
MPYKFLADCHSHSNCSFDGEAPMAAMCARAEALGLAYYALTDHCECDQYDGAPEFGGRKYFDSVRRAWRELEETKKQFPKLRFLKGIELGQPLQNLPAALDVLSGRDYDVVIGSLHNIAGMRDFYHLGRENLSETQLDAVFKAYFDEMYEMLEWGQFDTLAHITYPLRYVCKPGERPSFARYAQQLDRIFKKLIETDKALEFNTSRLLCTDAPVLPDREIFSRYHALGGRRVTLGADAHCPENVARGIPEALDMLREIGYTEYTVFAGRRPQQIPIEYIPEERV